MKFLRRCMFVLFIAAAAAYGYYTYMVKVKADVEAPVISVEGNENLELPVAAEDKDYLEGLRARDNVDGDVTDSLVMVSKSDFVSKGKLKVNFAAFDSSNNVGTFTRTVTYTDYVSPRFSLSSPLNLGYSKDSQDDLVGVTVNDMLDGDISGNIKEISTGSSDEDSEAVTLQVTNSAGDTTSIDVLLHRSKSDLYSLVCPWLSDYIFYVHPGEPEPDYRSRVKGTWVNGSGQEFITDETGREEEDDKSRFSEEDQAFINSLGQSYITSISGNKYYVKFDTSGIDYTTPGTYTGSCTLYSGTEELGKADFYVVVEENAS